MSVGFHVISLLFLPDLIQNWNVLTNFRYSSRISNFIKFRSAVLRSVTCRQTDMLKLGAFRSFPLRTWRVFNGYIIMCGLVLKDYLPATFISQFIICRACAILPSCSHVIRPSVCLSVYLYIYLSICLCTNPPIHGSTALCWTLALFQFLDLFFHSR
jgi:hypothetical protein